MSDLITYDDKIRLKSQNVSEKYKVTAGDMNEIKSVVNTNVELVDEINKPENWVSVGIEEPTDGRRVWFKKSKNLFVGYNNMLSGFLPQNGSYPITNTSFPNAKYMLINLKEGESITTSGITSNTNGRVRFIDEITNQVVGSIDQGSSSYYETTANYGDGFKNGTITAKKNFVVGIMMTNNNTTGLDNFQIEYGTTATSYEPYNRAINVDDEQWLNNTNLVSVSATSPTGGERVWFGKSKNLLPTNKYITTRTTNGITFTNNGDGTFNVSGTASANTAMTILPENNFQLEQGQAYYLYSNEAYNVDTFNLSIVMTEGSSTKFLTANHTYTPTTTPTNVRLQFYIASGKSVNKTNIKVMLVKGTTAPSQYEPYVDEGIYVDEEELHFDNYSTSEQVIGKWIDGKPLYRKVINFGALANSGNKTIPYDSSNNLIKFDIYAKNPSGYLFKVPFGGTNYINSYVDLNFHQIVVQTNSDRTNVTDNYVIVEYTKTTG